MMRFFAITYPGAALPAMMYTRGTISFRCSGVACVISAYRCTMPRTFNNCRLYSHLNALDLHIKQRVHVDANVHVSIQPFGEHVFVILFRRTPSLSELRVVRHGFNRFEAHEIAFTHPGPTIPV